MRPPARESSAPAVELRNISKRFGLVQANDGVSLAVRPGSIHAIIGENGAGKSTAMNVLYGMHRPDSGEILVAGQTRTWPSPLEAISAGLGMVHQHFMLAGRHTALENVILGAEQSRFGFLNRKAARARVESLAAQHGLKMELDRPIEDLPVGLQQRVEILKLLYRGARVLILDEPTAVLTPPETEALFENLRKLRDQGATIIVITHKLREVLAFSERITVMRAGKVVAEIETCSIDAQQLAELMIGRRLELRPNTATRAPARNEFALEAQELTLESKDSARRKLEGVNLVVRCGEIVGLAGVEGNGQSELINALLCPRDTHCRPPRVIRIGGADVTGFSTSRIRELGVAFIPEDRQQEGLIGDFSLIENFALGLHESPRFGARGFLRWRQIGAAAQQALEDFDVRPRNPEAKAFELSGGNQQKFIAAREFCREIKLLIAAQPARGVDIGATQFIHQQIMKARDAGAGVLLISSDLDEILALSDRIVVMFEGRITGEFKRSEVTERELGLRMSGAK
jgi:general nucleoside transport system ATP-binding protein